MDSEDSVKQELEELQKQLGKKQKFEASVSSLKSLLQRAYPSASPSLRKSFYSVICRVATVLKTRYTAPGFWNAGLGLFEQAHLLVSEPAEKEHLKACIAQAREHLHLEDNPSQPSQLTDNQANRGYLFEGHLTVDPEPAQPQWLVQSNLLTTAATLFAAESSQTSAANDTTQEDAANMLQDLINRLEEVVPLVQLLKLNKFQATDLMWLSHCLNIRKPGNSTVAPRAPPASKEVVAKLPVITLTEEILANMGKDVECAICRENLVLNDKMQELPCKHTFHPPCLKPWLDEHNSCPICRFELQTDDHAYESWKEREKEAEEERKGAENAIRGGEYILHNKASI
ncbi:E3 ubiquitin-protein ligase AIP2 [Mucuna pruriens]|uniref:RING-type E3 ubiquitin transferase n=1 Tax=Mucuna pruriens TaxID=157652 RepID=A0A371ER38_MUCPR|nr:E3 ubiquitin-protein ligase AIP2 [Mucuna pruriens]